MTRSEFSQVFAAALNTGLSTTDAFKRIRSKAVKTAVKTAIFNHMYELATPEILSMIEKEVVDDLNEFSMIDGWYDWKVKAILDSEKKKFIVQVAVKHSKTMEYTIYSGKTDC